MEIKEAIEIMKDILTEEWTENVKEAFNMAISALEKLEKQSDWDCPCCHSERMGIWQVGLDDPTKVEYRPDCWQKIDWPEWEVNENG